ncbi:MAG TPA: hypothetical protein VEK82_03990 [Stellaceae bacterium]|nr:hypothetical protein [Stellaceae bacterium]
MPPADRAAARREICDLLQPILMDETGLWIADYVRLRFRATFPGSPVVKLGAPAFVKNGN